MKRSTQVSLVLMTAAGVGSVAYALTPPDRCRQSAPNAVAADPQLDCRSSRGSSSGHGSAWQFFSGSGSSNSSRSGPTTSTPASTSSSRGGFGAIGRAFASFSGGG